MLVEIEFQYRLAEVNLHFGQMESSTETVVVALMVLLAGAYLGRRYLQKRRAKANGCAGSCGCAATKPSVAKR